MNLYTVLVVAGAPSDRAATCPTAYAQRSEDRVVDLRRLHGHRLPQWRPPRGCAEPPASIRWRVRSFHRAASGGMYDTGRGATAGIRPFNRFANYGAGSIPSRHTHAATPGRPSQVPTTRRAHNNGHRGQGLVKAARCAARCLNSSRACRPPRGVYCHPAQLARGSAGADPA